MSEINRIELDAVLDFDRAMAPDERLSRALGVMGLMGYQLRRALDEGGKCAGPRDALIDMAIRELERARRTDAVRRDAA